MIAGHQERKERGRLRRKPTGKGDRTAAALEACHALLEPRDRRIHDARVGIAIFLEVEIRRRRRRILEHIARGLEDRHRARAGIRVRTLAGVNLTSLEAEMTRLFHGHAS